MAGLVSRGGGGGGGGGGPSTVQWTVRGDHNFGGNVDSMTDHTPQCRSRSCSNSSPGYDKEQTLSLTLLKARWPAEQASQNAWRFAPFVRECISMATLVCAYGTANLTNRGPSELVEECIL